FEQANIGLVDVPVEPGAHRPVALRYVVAQADFAAGVVVAAERAVDRSQRVAERRVLDPSAGGKAGAFPAERVEVDGRVERGTVKCRPADDVAARFEAARNRDDVDVILDPAAVDFQSGRAPRREALL